jgi:hypothetical protein
MRRNRTQQAIPDLFSTEVLRTASPPQVSATKMRADGVSQRHVLPKDLPNAVEHLSDKELDLLITASIEEAKRRGRLPTSIQSNPNDKRKRSLSTDKVDEATISLARGQANVVRAAFNAGVTPSRIARQFGISQSDVRTVLAQHTTKRKT